jgi:hypothetical protein
MSLRQRLAAPTGALPLDLFRVLVGLIAFGYCLRQLADVPVFFAPDGLVPHAETQALFPFVWQPLFPPDLGAGPASLLLGTGALLALAVTFGLRPRLAALALYGIVVCAYRAQFLLLSVDDAMVHLLLLWVALLPVGSTLTRSSWRGGLRPSFAAWREVRVPGATLRLLLANLVLLYAVAGLSKWGSPLWRSGDALYATLRLPCSWVADSVGPDLVPLLRPLTWAALVLEPLFAVGLCLPPRGPLRAALVFGLALFHLGIAATLDVPFANLGCLAALPLLFRRELGPSAPATPPPSTRLALSESFALLVVGLLFGAMACSLGSSAWRRPSLEGRSLSAPEVPGSTAESGGPVQTAFFGALWVLGLAQQYRLLDWIDERNFHVVTTFRVRSPGAPDEHLESAAPTLPRGMRSSLLLSYVGGVTWMPVPDASRGALRDAIVARIAARHCRLAGGAREVRLVADYERVDPGRSTPRAEVTLALFRCTATGQLAPPSSP